MERPVRQCLTAVAVVLAVVATARAAETVRITAERADILADAKADSRVLATVSRGAILEVLGREGGWIRVAAPGTGYAGYIPAVYIEPGLGATPSAGAASRPAPTPAPAPAAPPSEPPAPAARAPQTYTPSAPSPTPAVAETPQAAGHGRSQEREGFWIGFGAGYGSASASASCEGCSGDGDREGSFTGFLKLGGTVNPQILVGAESNVWVKSQDNVTLTLGSLAGTVTYYPVLSSGFFLKAGVGLSYMSTDLGASGATVSVSKTGWGLLAGVGYDLRVGRMISLTPSFNYYYGKPGDLSVDGDLVVPGWKQNVLDFALGVTFH
jgi:hypothetical protein